MAIGDAKPISPSGDELIARAAKRTDWASRALAAASEDLRASHVPEFRSVADFLSASGEQTARVTRALNGGS